jgi:hypothetical protein
MGGRDRLVTPLEYSQAIRYVANSELHEQIVSAAMTMLHYRKLVLNKCDFRYQLSAI